ncbi:FKBP-type peptidyl-prolyl cis-trans isomerase FklB [hydrothermal vent metagenome]|uniref:peptidylprolyl isomerase n=1 Tax=hydrothermal vent metagenome TaxID=652676 RepID=A0A3B0UUM7_9ZZZZ
MPGKELKTGLEKFSYALGMSVTSNFIKSGLSQLDLETFVDGVSDTFNGEMPKLLPDEANKILEEFINESVGSEGDKNLKEGLEFLSENATKQGVVELPSGLQYSVISQGDDELPKPSDTVRCHYHGTLIDGTVFDSSVERGEPATFPVSGVIKGWVEALQLMPVGSKWRLFIPPGLGYGEQGAGGVIGPNTTLVFDVELLGIV